MLRRERGTVHLVREQDLVAQGVGDRKAALVVVLDLLLDPSIGTGEDEFHRLVERSGFLEQRPEWGPGPRGGADRLAQPRLRDRAR